MSAALAIELCSVLAPMPKQQMPLTILKGLEGPIAGVLSSVLTRLRLSPAAIIP